MGYATCSGMGTMSRFVITLRYLNTNHRVSILINYEEDLSIACRADNFCMFWGADNHLYPHAR